MSEQHFKVGQQVRINVPPETMNGTTGTIKGLAYGRYLVEFDAGGNGFFSGSDLEGEPLGSVTVTDELTRLRAENSRLRGALNELVTDMREVNWYYLSNELQQLVADALEDGNKKTAVWRKRHAAAEEVLKPGETGGA